MLKKTARASHVSGGIGADVVVVAVMVAVVVIRRAGVE